MTARSGTGTYAVDPVDAPSCEAQALLVRVAAGTLWIERRDAGTAVEVRIVKRPAERRATRTVFLAGGRDTARSQRLVRVRWVASG